MPKSFGVRVIHSPLMVSVSPLGFAKDFQPQVVLARLAEHTGRLRSELARAINRKKTPELVFRVVLTEDLPPQSVSGDADDFDEDDDLGDEE